MRKQDALRLWAIAWTVLMIATWVALFSYLIAVWDTKLALGLALVTVVVLFTAKGMEGT